MKRSLHIDQSCFEYCFVIGAISMLYTVPNYRGRRISELVCITLLQKQHAAGFTHHYGMCAASNESVRRAFVKIARFEEGQMFYGNFKPSQ